MIKVGITGQQGFIGRHLYNYLNLKEDVELIPFEREYFDLPEKMVEFVAKCDTIVHLAAMNRHKDPQVIFDTNIKLVQSLTTACNTAKVFPHILMSSSSQEDRDNKYGASKKLGREMLEKWADENNTIATGMIIPNVFGPFCRPFYNSVVATFCHQVISEEKPKIINDAVINIIYVNHLIDDIYKLILERKNGKVNIEARYSIKVSELLSKLKSFHSTYVQNGEFPELIEQIDLDLFNTFRCYLPNDFYPRAYTKHSDNRGHFVEIVRAGSRGQYSFSTTKPNITRGNHFHTRKVERFAVIQGKASIQLRKIDTDEVIEYIIDGETPGYVDMPIWHTHNITNIGEEELVTLFWINEPYDPDDADTYYIAV